jgi:hypothetical protein
MYEGRHALGYLCEEVLQGHVKQRGVGFGRRALATNRKAIVMKKLALRKTLTLVAVLPAGSAFIPGDAHARGVGGEFIDGQALATGGNFSCSEPIGDRCPNDEALPRRSIERSKMTSHNHKGAQPYQDRY